MGALLLRYRAERFPLGMAFPVPCLLALAAWPGGFHSVTSFAIDSFLGFLLFGQFRILDDLADRHRDAAVHPARLLVRSTTVWPVAAAGLLLATLSVAMLWLRGDRLATGFYAALVVLLPTWYLVRGPRTLAGDHLLLLKYPAFVWILATSRLTAAGLTFSSVSRAQIALSMLATYLAVCIYEPLHDASSPARTRPAIVAGEVVLLALTVAALSIRGTA
jgi:hypothetical protein